MLHLARLLRTETSELLGEMFAEHAAVSVLLELRRRKVEVFDGSLREPLLNCEIPPRVGRLPLTHFLNPVQ